MNDTRRGSVYAPISTDAREVLERVTTSRMRQLEFARRFGRRPTVAEIAFDFAYGEHEEFWERVREDHTWCLDPLDAVHVLLARIEQLEREAARHE